MPDSLRFHANGYAYTESTLPGTSLLSLLRQVGWTSVHRVCESGDCGACTVWVDGLPIHSCLYPAQRINNRAVTTLEGLTQAENLSPMQQAFLAKQGFQCGYCTPGMILSAERLADQPESELRQALRGNLCRCTGYQAIVESIQFGQTLADMADRSDGEESQPMPMPCPSAVSLPQVGANIPKQDGREIVTGTAHYTADWAPPGLLHLKVLRSPHPHARIRRIVTDQAKALPGVQAVLTYEDVPRRPYTTAGHAEPVPDPLDHYLLDNRVRFIGDRVAAVVADSVAIAERACQLIEVEYELLPHVTDPLQAMGRKAPGFLRSGQESRAQTQVTDPPPLIHDEPDSCQIYDVQHNIAGHVLLESGDIEQGFANADWILENTYDLPAVQHTHLEPHVSISWFDEDGMLVVRSSTQVPFHCQRVLSEIFDLPREKIRVFKAKLGGGFGNKQEILTEDLCVLATLRTGRPVQWELTRHEEFTATNSRHAMQIRLKTGMKADGTLVAQELVAIANTGAYGNHSTTVVFLTGYLSMGLYRCANRRFEGFSVYTNTMPAGAFRGYGATQGTFAVESQLDEMAAKSGIDPIALRLKNLIRPGDVLTLGRSDDHFNLIGSYVLDACIEKVVQALDYQPGQPPVVEGQHRRGKGIAVSMQGSGLSKIHPARVRLSLEPTGQFCLKTGAVDVGTGSDTTLRQIAAQHLGVATADIQLVTADTQLTPFDAGSYASATLYISGQAVNRAAQQLHQVLLELAAPYLHAEPAGLTLANGVIHTTDAHLSLLDLIQQLPADALDRLTVELEYTADESTLTFAVQGVEIDVDLETGKIELLRCVQAVDLGTAINPRICEGQVTGGAAMGIGYALMEELQFNAQGQILNPGFRTYRIPTAADVPPMQVILMQSEDPYGPFGAKGVGEVTTNSMAPAIANALAQATGIRLTQLPMTPERVWRSRQIEPDCP